MPEPAPALAILMLVLPNENASTPRPPFRPLTVIDVPLPI
jgi:hypothetical protein